MYFHIGIPRQRLAAGADPRAEDHVARPQPHDVDRHADRPRVVPGNPGGSATT